MKEAEPVEPTADDIMAECVAIESERRKWLRGITQLLQGPRDWEDIDPRVKFAVDMMLVAACERATRILRSDLGADQA